MPIFVCPLKVRPAAKAHPHLLFRFRDRVRRDRRGGGPPAARAGPHAAVLLRASDVEDGDIRANLPREGAAPDRE